MAGQCTIARDQNGEIQDVFAPNGKSSNLFKDALESLGISFNVKTTASDSVQGKQFQKPQEKLNQIQEVFNENPELANAVYEALGFDNVIAPNDKIIWGHPAIGKSYAAKKVKMIDFDSYKLGINKKFKGRKPKIHIESE